MSFPSSLLSSILQKSRGGSVGGQPSGCSSGIPCFRGVDRKHSSFELIFVCLQKECCNSFRPICAQCLHEEHSGHAVKLISEIAESAAFFVKTERSKSSPSPSWGQLQTTYTQLFTEIGSIIKHLQTYQDALEQTNTTFFSRLNNDKEAFWRSLESTSNMIIAPNSGKNNTSEEDLTASLYLILHNLKIDDLANPKYRHNVMKEETVQQVLDNFTSVREVVAQTKEFILSTLAKEDVEETYAAAEFKIIDGDEYLEITSFNEEYGNGGRGSKKMTSKTKQSPRIIEFNDDEDEDGEGDHVKQQPSEKRKSCRSISGSPHSQLIDQGWNIQNKLQVLKENQERASPASCSSFNYPPPSSLTVKTEVVFNNMPWSQKNARLVDSSDDGLHTRDKQSQATTVNGKKKRMFHMISNEGSSEDEETKGKEELDAIEQQLQKARTRAHPVSPGGGAVSSSSSHTEETAIPHLSTQQFMLKYAAEFDKKQSSSSSLYTISSGGYSTSHELPSKTGGGSVTTDEDISSNHYSSFEYNQGGHLTSQHGLQETVMNSSSGGGGDLGIHGGRERSRNKVTKHEEASEKLNQFHENLKRQQQAQVQAQEPDEHRQNRQRLLPSRNRFLENSSSSSSIHHKDSNRASGTVLQ